jgi:hypothetical protein
LAVVKRAALVRLIAVVVLVILAMLVHAKSLMAKAATLTQNAGIVIVLMVFAGQLTLIVEMVSVILEKLV